MKVFDPCVQAAAACVKEQAGKCWNRLPKGSEPKFSPELGVVIPWVQRQCPCVKGGPGGGGGAP